MEIIDARLRDEASHFFIEAVVQAGKKGDRIDPAEKYEVEFKVNGVELPFLKTIETVYNLFRKDIDRAAAELLLEKAHQEISAIDELTSDLILHLKKRAKELFNVKLDED